MSDDGQPKIGRPVFWTPEKMAEAQLEICEQIAAGRSLKSILDNAEHLPSRETVYKWLFSDEAFSDNYVRAREAQADFHADEVIDIADTEADPNKARVRIDARKWVAGKMRPKVYGDRLQLDGDMNVRLTDQQVESRLAQLLGKAGAVAAAGGAGTPEGET